MPTTARLYTDMGLLTCQPDFGEDATNVFNLLTGIGHFEPGKKILLSPIHIASPDAGTDRARGGQRAAGPAGAHHRQDERAVRRRNHRGALRASQAGVKIDLLVRGICCLRPGVPGVSENITVRSIVDRFLEHSRIFYFENAGQPEVFLGSADWMPRNFFRRIEAMFPVEDARLRRRVQAELLGIPLADEARAWFLNSDGAYRRVEPTHQPPFRSQLEFIRLASGGALACRGSPRERRWFWLEPAGRQRPH